MTVEITDGVHWLNECYLHDGLHEHVAAYLIDHDGEYILIDSGSFYHRERIIEGIDEVTGGDGLDTIILSHSDYPHAGNVSQLRDKWADVELIASSGSPEIQGLSDARRCTIGESLDVLGRQFSFIDPPLADRSHTTWIYDHGSAVLFTADGFGSYHEPGNCRATSRTFETGVPQEMIYRYHANNLVWLRYVDPTKLDEALTSIMNSYEISFVAPIHGHPIHATDLDRFFSHLISAAERIASEYEVPSP